MTADVRELLGEACVGVDQARGADSWVFQVVRAGWAIVVSPIDGRGAPYETTVSAPGGSPRYYSSHSPTVEIAVRKGCDVLESEGVEFNRVETERLGWAVDRTAL